MKILYLCHRFPYPPQRGGKIRPFNMIRHLSEKHEVTVISLVRSEAEAQAGQPLREFARLRMLRVHDPVQTLRMIARVPTPVPSSFGFFYSPAMARAVQSELASQRFDLVFVHCSSVAPYVARVTGTPKILDFGDMDSQKWLEYARYKPFPLSLGYRLEGMKLVAEEKRLARAFDLCTATTRGEWEALDALHSARATDWFPNGVDSGYFAPSDEAWDPDSICFVGRMDYFPNQECMLDFCRNVWPAIRARRPSARLAIIGAEPPPAIARLGELPGVTVTGTVPDVRPHLLRSAAMVAPLKIARGTQNKILEAMASGVPVVTSSVAAGGVDAIAGEHLLTADTPQELADAVLRLMGDRSERARLARAGRERMLSHHSWHGSMQRLDRIIARCVGAPAAQEPRASAAARRDVVREP